MANEFQVDVVTPMGKIHSSKAESVSLMLTNGSITILADHAPLLAVISPCIVKIIREGSPFRYKVCGGFLEVERGRVVILSDEVKKITH